MNRAACCVLRTAYQLLCSLNSGRRAKLNRNRDQCAVRSTQYATHQAYARAL